MVPKSPIMTSPQPPHPTSKKIKKTLLRKHYVKFFRNNLCPFACTSNTCYWNKLFRKKPRNNFVNVLKRNLISCDKSSYRVREPRSVQRGNWLKLLWGKASESLADPATVRKSRDISTFFALPKVKQGQHVASQKICVVDYVLISS